jgi:hypothetical protein
VRVLEVRHVRDHILWLRFSDGLAGEVDLSAELIGPMLQPLCDAELFARVRIEGPTIAWPTGADWPPEALHHLVLGANGHDARQNDDGQIPTAAHLARMPEISRFFGIVIRMFYSDHVRPHFHAQFGEASIAVEITGDGIRGSFPPHRLPLIFEWRDLHRDELVANWERLRLGQRPVPIDPLD